MLEKYYFSLYLKRSNDLKPSTVETRIPHYTKQLIFRIILYRKHFNGENFGASILLMEFFFKMPIFKNKQGL